ncbi:MAG: hypothetical protein ABL949_13845 [Fimbriimonadaceae bacterium]
MDPRNISVALASGLVLAVVFGFTRPQTDTVAERVKTVGTAMLAYSADFDDALPLQCPNVDGKWQSGKFQRKSDLTGALGSVWSIALLPYVTEGPAALRIEGPTFEIQGGEYPSAMSFNGLLHAVETSRIASSEFVPLVWTPFGKQNVSAVITTPVMMCQSTLPCNYFDLKNGQGSNMIAPPSLVIPELEALYVINVDLTLKRPAPKGENWTQAVYTSDPVGGTWTCFGADENGTTTGARSHPCYFRPDRTE